MQQCTAKVKLRPLFVRRAAEACTLPQIVFVSLAIRFANREAAYYARCVLIDVVMLGRYARRVIAVLTSGSECPSCVAFYEAWDTLLWNG